MHTGVQHGCVLKMNVFVFGFVKLQEEQDNIWVSCVGLR